MGQDPRFALRQFIASLELHLEASLSKRSPEDPAVDRAYQALTNAFMDYEEALDAATQEYLPFELAEDE